MAAPALNIAHLQTLLDDWDKEQPQPQTHAAFGVPLEQARCALRDALKDVVVAFRTRPPLPNEAAEKFRAESEFCRGITAAGAQPGVFVAHVPSTKWNGVTLSHKTYNADLAFGSAVDNEEVYQRAVVANDVLSMALSGGVGCVLAYGQTGSGKTHTMEGLEHRIARDLFEEARVLGKRLAEAHAGEVPDEIFEFRVTFLELLGKRASDLLEVTTEDENAVRSEVAVREDTVGNVRPALVSTAVGSSEELENLINKALSHRRTSATLRNAKSSRSHAVLTISIKNVLLPFSAEGQLILVDLAGSERYEDSKEHDKQRMNEVRENNSSLMHLKECVRAKARMSADEGFVHVPWRTNKLTMLLKPIFDIESRQPSRAIIIAHVSPHIQDSIHSTNTLSYAAPFMTALPKAKGPAPYDVSDPRTWDHEQTVTWLTRQFAKPALASRLAAWKVKEKAAILAGKKLKPLEPLASEDVDIGVDVLQICPPGSTAKNVGALYAAEFVERCLQARTRPTVGGGQAAFSKMAIEVSGELSYLFMKAKTRTRNELMKTRKTWNAKEIYG
ncbi:unnamed protein product [Mycena citricolor]|uniref:Kinesin-like protein n=1 Tax=Mycena citricolor TaxID=2018698 RepID=A0AAD2GY75_9AGAR|nr:unnamed protein product [Mycena citricolor]